MISYDYNSLLNATVKIDGSGNKEFQRAMLRYLRQQIGSGKVIKFKVVDSKKDNLNQLADMVVGAIARSHNKKRDDSKRWLEMLQSNRRIDNIWDFR